VEEMYFLSLRRNLPVEEMYFLLSGRNLPVEEMYFLSLRRNLPVEEMYFLLSRRNLPVEEMYFLSSRKLFAPAKNCCFVELFVVTFALCVRSKKKSCQTVQKRPSFGKKNPNFLTVDMK
jgi:hypothetical protein